MTTEEIKIKQKHATREVIYWGLGGAGVLLVLFILQKYILGGQFIGNLIVDTPKLYCLIIWVAFIQFSSIFESFYYTHEIRSGFVDNFNEHPLFVMIRASVLIPLWILTDWRVVLCLFFIFPFFHDGNYYRWRDKIIPGTYKKRWFAQSTTSTAWSTKFMTPIVRTSIAALALIALFLI